LLLQRAFTAESAYTCCAFELQILLHWPGTSFPLQHTHKPSLTETAVSFKTILWHMQHCLAPACCYLRCKHAQAASPGQTIHSNQLLPGSPACHGPMPCNSSPKIKPSSSRVGPVPQVSSRVNWQSIASGSCWVLHLLPHVLPAEMLSFILSTSSAAGQLAGGSRKRESQSTYSYVCLSQGPSQDAEGVHHPFCA